MKIVVVGLGKMGLGMALSIQRAGYYVYGYDKNEMAARVALESGIDVIHELSEVASEVVVYVLSLPNAAIVEAVVSGDKGIKSFARNGSLVIDTSTSDPQTTRRLAAELSPLGLGFIDAPVSGGAKGALAGELTMFIGGSTNDVEAAEGVLKAMGTKRFHIGASGAGNVGKILNNLLCASHLIIAGEAFRLGRAAGVEPLAVLDAINTGSGRSGVTLYNFPARILNGAFDSGFTMQLMRKDVRLAMSLAEAVGVNLPVSGLVGDFWSESSKEIPDFEDFNRIVEYIPAK
ncbi:NAD(P)-dependent oxidoreductase [Pseudomonas fluorescens]|uniref:NAD(P)-dependent oxidoreductase n=1 Tax=Pseudomonas fluorescens TaxID=294 RepID=UPI000732088C|nr:NAD(P)-dependent oxidoreductase [Pseudomonas fluorescens]